MTIAEQLIQQGMQQGMQEGMQEGEIENAREAIVNVLDARFGHIPSSVRERLAGISDQCCSGRSAAKGGHRCLCG